MHIATRGLLDGEYGKVTRGYIICPDIVPRFPQDADIVVEDGSWATVSQRDMEATLADYPRLTFEGAVRQLLLEAKVNGDVYEETATVADIGLEAAVFAVEDVVGEAVESGLGGEVGADRDIGDVTDEDARATVAQVDELVGEAEDGPPYC